MQISDSKRGLAQPTTCKADGQQGCCEPAKAGWRIDLSFQGHLTFHSSTSVGFEFLFVCLFVSWLRNTSYHRFFKFQIGFRYGTLAINTPIPDGQPGASRGVSTASSIFSHNPHSSCSTVTVVMSSLNKNTCPCEL